MTRPALLACLASAVLLAPALGARQTARTPADPACAALTTETADRCLRLNHLQLLGTHNSYHVAPQPPVLALFGTRADGYAYTHRSLTHQLTTLGVRQFEIDVFADPDGGRYASPAGLRLARGASDLERPGPEMARPGFKVLHVQDLDFRTTCSTLDSCLREIHTWSRLHPRHVPVMVMIELKDGALEDPDGVGYVRPVPFDRGQLDALDTAIRTVFDDHHLVTPDDVRGGRATLREAIERDGWPRLHDVRGKVLFAMDNTDAHLDTYLDGHPALRGRVMFVSAPPGSPASAFLKLNDPGGDEQARIASLVRAGYIVRTRADTPTIEARSGNTARRDQAFRSGAHFVSTDYPEPSPFGSGYVVRLPAAGARAARCNPVSAPAGCRDEWLESQ
jgi:hypothetical protein